MISLDLSNPLRPVHKLLSVAPEQAAVSICVIPISIALL